MFCSSLAPFPKKTTYVCNVLLCLLFPQSLSWSTPFLQNEIAICQSHVFCSSLVSFPRDSLRLRCAALSSASSLLAMEYTISLKQTTTCSMSVVASGEFNAHLSKASGRSLMLVVGSGGTDAHFSSLADLSLKVHIKALLDFGLPFFIPHFPESESKQRISIPCPPAAFSDNPNRPGATIYECFSSSKVLLKSSHPLPICFVCPRPVHSTKAIRTTPACHSFSLSNMTTTLYR